MKGLKTINLKSGMPSLEDARLRLAQAISQGRGEGCVALKIVHGYGSSGVGGSLRTGLRSSLRKRRKKGEIKDFVTGEKWSVFEEQSRRILDECQQLSRDPDLDRYNEGITIVIL